MSKLYTVDFTVTRSQTQSVTVEADNPAEAIKSIRDEAPSYGSLADKVGYTDVMIHACEQRKVMQPTLTATARMS